jgi:hypothetical protein
MLGCPRRGFGIKAGIEWGDKTGGRGGNLHAHIDAFAAAHRRGTVGPNSGEFRTIGVRLCMVRPRHLDRCPKLLFHQQGTVPSGELRHEFQHTVQRKPGIQAPTGAAGRAAEPKSGPNRGGFHTIVVRLCMVRAQPLYQYPKLLFHHQGTVRPGELRHVRREPGIQAPTGAASNAASDPKSNREPTQWAVGERTAHPRRSSDRAGCDDEAVPSFAAGVISAACPPGAVRAVRLKSALPR